MFRSEVILTKFLRDIGYVGRISGGFWILIKKQITKISGGFWILRNESNDTNDFVISTCRFL
jgi:hypothetical protein